MERKKNSCSNLMAQSIKKIHYSFFEVHTKEKVVIQQSSTFEQRKMLIENFLFPRRFYFIPISN